VAGVLQLVNPEFMSLLWTDEMGRKMLGAMLVMMALGSLWIRKLIRIRV